MDRFRWTFGISVFWGGMACLIVAAGGVASERPAHLDANPVLSQFLEKLLRDQLQGGYVDDDKWGQTRQVAVGHHLTGKPFRWKLEPREKVVNDGLWEKYSVWLKDPDEHLEVYLRQLEWQEGKVRFTLAVSAKLAGDARLERWRQGVKMLNTHLEANALVDLTLTGQVAFRLTTGNGSLPAIAIEPAITDLDIKLKQFKLKRISKLDGGLVHELGNSLEDTIQHELHRRESKIVTRLNRSIAKRQDQLTLSAEQFAKTGWAKLQGSLEANGSN